LSHAGAYLNNPKTQIIAGCSTEVTDCNNFSEYYNIPTFSNATEMLKEIKPDIVSICSPTEFHFEHFVSCLRANVPMIWLEKPPANNYKDIKKMLQLSSQTDIKVLVNYTRRFLKYYIKLKDHFNNRIMGRPKDIVLHYSKGLLINGSHIIDSAFMMFGNKPEQFIKDIKVINNSDNPSFVITNDTDIPIYVIGHNVPYHSREISVSFEGGRISINQEGHKNVYEKRVEQEYYPGYYRLNDVESENEEVSDFDKSITNALTNLINAHENNICTDSNLLTAKISQKVISIVMNEC